MNTVVAIIAGVAALGAVILVIMAYLRARSLYDKLDTATAITVES